MKLDHENLYDLHARGSTPKHAKQIEEQDDKKKKQGTQDIYVTQTGME